MPCCCTGMKLPAGKMLDIKTGDDYLSVETVVLDDNTASGHGRVGAGDITSLHVLNCAGMNGAPLLVAVLKNRLQEQVVR